MRLTIKSMFWTCFAMALVFGMATDSQGALIFSSGPINGHPLNEVIDPGPPAVGTGNPSPAYFISGNVVAGQPNAVTNAFVVFADVTLGSITVGLTVNQGATPLQLNWAIEPAPSAPTGQYGTTFSGTSAVYVSGAPIFDAGANTDTYAATFNVTPGGIPLLASNLYYYLTLSGATSTSGGVKWDTTDQPWTIAGGFAAHYVPDPDFIGFHSDSITPQSFSLEDTAFIPPAPPVPEPTSLALMAIGAIGAAIGTYRRRRVQAKFVA